MKISMVGFGPIESKSNGYFIRCHHLVESLSKLGHEVVVMEFPEEGPEGFNRVEGRVKHVWLKGNEQRKRGFLQFLQRELSFDLIRQLRFQIYSIIELILHRRYIGDCDVVFVEGALIPFAVILAKLLGKTVVLDTHCINKLLALGYKERSFLKYMVRKNAWDVLERFSIKLSDKIIAVSKRELEFIKNEYKISSSKIFVVPNVMETPRMEFFEGELRELEKRWGLKNKTIVTFVGNLKSVQNRDAVQYILSDLAPFFLKKRGDAVFLIIGQGNEQINCAPSNTIFTGYVENIAPFLMASKVCIAPLRIGSGIKTKVLEYMAYGKTVVTTPIGIEGLILDKAFLIVCGIDTFPETLLHAIENLNESDAGSDEKRKFIEHYYSPNSMKKKIEELIKSIETEQG